jgi:hypothetical protein
MKETHSAAIIFLLAAILSVLLFGANVVLAGTGAIIAIGIALAAIVAVIVFSGIIISKLPGFAAGFLRGWIKIVAAPVTAPVQYWRTIRDRRSHYCNNRLSLHFVRSIDGVLHRHRDSDSNSGGNPGGSGWKMISAPADKNAARDEELDRIPFQKIDRSKWPSNVRPIAIGEADGLGIDKRSGPRK